MDNEDSIFIVAGSAIAVTGAALVALGARFRAVPGNRRGATLVFVSGLFDMALGIGLICWRTLT